MSSVVNGVEVAGLSHIGVRVRHLETARAFYELLGFRQLRDVFEPGPVALLGHPTGVVLHLILNAGDPDGRNVLLDDTDKRPGFTHVAFWVPSVDEARGRLESAGFTITEEAVFLGEVRAIFVRDPDGNVVEMDERIAG